MSYVIFNRCGWRETSRGTKSRARVCVCYGICNLCDVGMGRIEVRSNELFCEQSQTSFLQRGLGR